MPELFVAAAPPKTFEDVAEMRRANASLLEAIDGRLGQDSRWESEAAVLRELESEIRAFLDRGAATGAFIEDIRERTACQVLLDYWSSTLSHGGIQVARSRLAPFDAARLPDLSDEECPFVGLESFRDGTFFFGRDKAVASLLQRVSEVPLVIVQGASGSGKSSLVIGGALPVIGATSHVPCFRVIGPFTPGNAVLESLVSAVAAALPDAQLDRVAEAEALRGNSGRLPQMLSSAAAAPVLLVVDQFEEVFTLCSDRDRTTMAAALDALLRSYPACRVILTLREEFTNELDKLEPLRSYLAQHARFSMKEWPMGYDDLRAAVERPAALVNLHFAPGIVDELVKSVLGQDTALPLLQFALESLWKQRDRNRITRDIYEQVGSPLVALERYADDFYHGLSHENQEEAKRILLELVRIDRMLEAYREPRMRSTLLATGNPRTSEMLELLAREGFVRITPTADANATVEVKHEALLRNWPRYAGWIVDKRERARQRIKLTDAAQRWHDRGRSPSEGLLTGWQLDDAQHLPGLSRLEQDYVQASIDAADAARRAHERDMLWRQRLRLTTFATLVVLVLSLAWAISAHRDRNLIAEKEQSARVEEQFARVKENSYRGRIDHALTGALRAGSDMSSLPDKVRAALRPELREVLLSTLRNAPDLRRLFFKDGATLQAAAFHPTRPDALLAFGGSDGQTYLASLADNGPPFAKSLDTCNSQGVSALAFDPQGHLLVVGCRSGALSVWSADDWHLIGERKQVFHNSPIRTLGVHPGDRLIAAGGPLEDSVALVQLDDHGAPSNQQSASGRKASGQVWSLAFSPVGDTLLVGDGNGNVLVCQPGGGQSWDCKQATGYVPAKNDAILALAYSPDGAQIAIGHYSRGAVEVWDAKFSPGSRRAIYHQSQSAVYSLAFFEACGRQQLAIGTETGLEYSPVEGNPQGVAQPEACALARSAQIGDETYSLASHSPDGLLAAATRAGYVAVLDPSSRQDPLRTRVSPMATSKPIRGALVAEAGSTAWLALPTAPTETDPANVVLLKLREGRVDDGIRFAAGDGEIRRFSASTQTRRLATLACRPSSNDCSVNVWEFTAPPTVPTRVVSLATADFDGRVPSRAVLSPNGKWLVISFRTPQRAPLPEPLLVLRLDGRSNKIWLDSNLQTVWEIAFSDDSSTFAAGGCCAAAGPDGDLHQVRLWSVGPSGFESRGSPLTLTPIARRVQELAFAADEKGHLLLLAGGLFGTINRWDVSTESKLESLRTDAHEVSFIAFSRGGSLVAAADSQGVVRIWDTSTWVPFQLTPPTDTPAKPGFLAFAGNGTSLAASADKADLWDLDLSSLQRKICALLREPGQHGANSATPLWHADRECKEGALTSPPARSYLQRARDFLMHL